jgi:hypothetical protein
MQYVLVYFDRTFFLSIGANGPSKRFVAVAQLLQIV